MQHRPLFKYSRDHSALFSELARFRNLAAQSLGLTDYEFHKTPKFIGPNGERLTIEPERSIVVPSVDLFKGVRQILTDSVRSLTPITHSEIGYRYPTAALAGLDAPFIKRMRSEYFHRVDEDRSICRPVNLSYGIKSRGKADNRQEYEVWLPDDDPDLDPLPLLIDKYGEDLPDDVRAFVHQPSAVHGWMGVKRAAFEALYQNPAVMGDLVMCVAFSVDAYNIGARPDLSYSPEVESSIAVSNAELEWEVMGFYAPKGAHPDHDFTWNAINHTLAAVGAPISDVYASVIIPIAESKTERILSTIRNQGITTEHIAYLNLQPWEFLQTTSEHRVKSHDPSRTVNLLGRLNRLFYQPERKLPSIQYIHDLISQDAY
ncbi:hypothetical protein DXV75_09180 [Alteromonas aestuariivivens]|uniref:Uncharacterized protein n=1 Tax=Alteromonas aestuariivivens TaxID=1938339 RepID=A0A3D8M7N0_9ALTE|nr:hypothetical protein [Alteromonas aestuariivivens]RDV25670.1 hypothetical protein DXV75_09180 [Alteromonas aestuariivivens]